MNKTTTLAAVLVALTASPLLAQDARVSAQSSAPGAYPGNHGQAVVSLRNFAGGGPAFAVGAPFETGGGPLAGTVFIHRGFNGSILRQVFGTGSPTSCAGPVVVGDQLGTDLIEIGDFDNDGFDDLLATRPGAGLQLGSCIQPGHGGFQIILSSGNQDRIVTAQAQIGLGRAAARLADDAAGRPQFAITDVTGAVHIYRRNGTVLPSDPVLVSTISGFGQTGSALAGAGAVNGVAAFAVNGPQQVILRDVNGANLGTISPPAGTGFSTGFGRSLAYFPDPANGDALVIGEPLYSGNAGRAHLASIAGSVIIQSTVGSGTDRLGSLVAAARDIDDDGVLDYVASTSGGRNLLILNRFGGQTQRPIQVFDGNGTTLIATSISVGDDMTADGYPDVLVGAAGRGSSFVYFGGPEASVSIVGASCSRPGSSVMASLGLNADPIVGTTPSFGMFGASPNSVSALMGGTIDPVGTVIAPGTCRAFLVLSTLVGGPTLITDSLGNWGPVPVTVPRILGASFGFQSVTVSTVGGTSLEFTNALELTIGW